MLNQRISGTSFILKYMTTLLVGVIIFAVILMGDQQPWSPSSVLADQNFSRNGNNGQDSSRMLIYRRIELTGTGYTIRGRGSAVVKSVDRDQRTIETLAVEASNLVPNQNVLLLLNGGRLAGVSLETDGQGHLSAEFVRGQQPVAGQRPMPFAGPSTTQIETVEILTKDGEFLLGGSYDLVRGSLDSIRTVRVVNAAGNVLLRGEFTSTSPSGTLILTAKLEAVDDPNATGEANVRFVELSAGGFDQAFELKTDDLDIEPPFALELDGGEVALFTTNFSGRADIVYESRLESQAGETEARSAVNQAELRVVEAEDAIALATAFGADVSEAQSLLADAQSLLADAVDSLARSQYDSSIDDALVAEETARDASLEAADAGDEAEEAGVDNSNDNGSANDNSNDNGTVNDNSGDNDADDGTGNDNTSDNDADDDSANDNGSANDNSNDNGNVNDNSGDNDADDTMNDNSSDNDSDDGTVNDNSQDDNGNDNGTVNDNNSNDNGNDNGTVNDNSSGEDDHESDDDHEDDN